MLRPCGEHREISWLAMKVLITGANRGIGLEFTRQYATAGHQVVATCRDPQTAFELLSLRDALGSIEIIRLDVTNDGHIRHVADLMNDEPLDALINNAVRYGEASFDLNTLDRVEWLRMFDINCIGPVHLTAALRPALRLSETPKVACIGSVKASNARNTLGQLYAYRSSKASLNSAFCSLAIDLAPDRISVFILSPGWVDQGKRNPSELTFEQRLQRARHWKEEFGGFSARQSLTVAVSKMIAQIERLGPEDSGGFFDHMGDRLPW